MGQASSSHKITEQDKAIHAMKVQRDKLQQYQKKVTVITVREKEIAQECLRRGDKRRALLALRRKKYQETLLANTDKQLEQLEILVLDVEFARVQKDVMYGLKQGTMVLKQMQKEMGGIEQVEKLLAEGEEAAAYQKEVSDMLAGRMSNQEEDEVEEELEALDRLINGVKDREGLQEELPTVPTHSISPKEAQKERWERRAREQQEAILA